MKQEILAEYVVAGFIAGRKVLRAVPLEAGQSRAGNGNPSVVEAICFDERSDAGLLCSSQDISNLTLGRLFPRARRRRRDESDRNIVGNLAEGVGEPKNYTLSLHDALPI